VDSIHHRALRRSRGAARALEDFSLIIDTGEVFGFLGPNGAGKTTTIRLLLGLLAPSAGRATVLGRPVSRSAQVAAAAWAVVAGLALIAAAGWAGTAAGLRTRPPEGVAAADLLPVAAMSLLLFAAFGAIALLVSATQREGGTAVSWCAGILAGSYVLDYLARVWTAIAFLRPLSLFRYYEPQRVLRDGLVAGDVLVLSAVGAVALAAAFAVFARRDL
jgi:energy-coupling factor transporter ATP-binding protein EcfA2